LHEDIDNPSLHAWGRQREGGGQELAIVLAGQEASDYLDFVIKDESTGTWCAVAKLGTALRHGCVSMACLLSCIGTPAKA
jgi:hypothetical protein